MTPPLTRRDGQKLYEVLIKKTTVCPKSLFPIYTVTYFVKWVKSFRTDSKPKLSLYTVCPRSIDPFYTVSYYIKWVKLLGHAVQHIFKNVGRGGGRHETYTAKEEKVKRS